MSECTFRVGTRGQLGKKPYPVVESTYRIGVGLDTSLIPIHAISYLYTDSSGGYLKVFKISRRAEVVTYPRRNVTMVCGVSHHIFGSCIYLQDTKIRFNCKSNLTSAVGVD
jgi:hypothetical protein